VTEKICDHASVGVLITDDVGRLLVFERVTFPMGIAPPAGHVFDDHGSRDDSERAYLAAARGEVEEEVGLIVTSLQMVAEGWVDNRCRRQIPDGRIGHQWQVYRASATGTLTPSKQEARNAQWLTSSQLQSLTERTVGWVRGDISNDEFTKQPGIEPIWVWWFARLGLVSVKKDDLATMFPRNT
jgi:ADP-ribose pyrophosphatase YjhB (NUDIX family)